MHMRGSEKNLIERQAGIYCLGQKSNINDPGLKLVNDILIGTLINLYSSDILLERQANK